MTGDPHRDAECGITPLASHLAAARKRSMRFGIGLAVLVAGYVMLVIASGWSTGVIIAGLIVCLLAILLAYRTTRADHLETDRLLDETAWRDRDA